MTRLLLPAAAVVENGASTSGGSCRNNFVEASGAVRGFGPPPRQLKSRLLDAISEAVALTVDLFDESSPRRKLSERRCRHKTFAERSAWRF